jgi:hypothetical protein
MKLGLQKHRQARGRLQMRFPTCRLRLRQRGVGTVSLVNKKCLDKYRRDSVREYANITRAPENIPPTPRPAMALPTINAVLGGRTTYQGT